MLRPISQEELDIVRRQSRTALLKLISGVTSRTEIDTETFGAIVRVAIFSGLTPEDIASRLSVSRNGVMRWADESMSPHELVRGEFVVKIRRMLEAQ